MFYRLLMFFISIPVRFWFRLSVEGRENLTPETNGRPIIYIANHVSWLDALFMSIVLPKDVPFVIYRGTLKRLWCRVLTMFSPRPIAVDTASPYAVRDMLNQLMNSKSKKIAIFPEGRLTTTGSIMRIQDGAGMLAVKSDAVLVPIWIDGVRHVLVNRLKGKVNRFLRPKISITIGKAFSIDEKDYKDMTAKMTRGKVSNIIESKMTATGLNGSVQRMNIPEAIMDAAFRNGPHKIILNDLMTQEQKGRGMTYKEFITEAVVLGGFLNRQCPETTDMRSSGDRIQAPIGIFLPNSVKTASIIIGLSMYDRITHPYNFSASASALKTITETLRIHYIVTARGFIEKAKLQQVVETLEQSGCVFIYLEDVKNNLGTFDKIRGIFNLKTGIGLPGLKVSAEKPFIALATSGSEGVPKGVILSHDNILSNISQVTRSIDVSAEDRFLNAMPMFHSFGLMGGLLLPLIQGAYTFQYVSPLHGRVITTLAYEQNITIMFATNTFLKLWARHAREYDFYKVRAIVAGAEALEETTRRMYSDNFKTCVLQGYGATETAPVIAMETFRHSRIGSVGKLLPGMSYSLRPIEGRPGNVGELSVSGPNVMLGYIKHENPGILIATVNNTYNTGDVVRIDEDGFIFYETRNKRIIKVAGEMISLDAVEKLANETFILEIAEQKDNAGSKSSQMGNAVIGWNDDKKGQKAILLTTLSIPEKEMIARMVETARSYGYDEKECPKTILQIEAIPRLGTGKVNYPELNKLAMEKGV